MEKKYKLNIPEMIRKEDAWIVAIIVRHNFVEVSEKWCGSFESATAKFNDIPKDWLEEIKDEPMGGVAAMHIWENSGLCSKSSGGIFLDGFQEGEENQKKRNRPKQTFEEWLSTLGIRDGQDIKGVGLYQAWLASENSHGWESED